jgi:quinol monooxygenase YgiN
MIHVIAVVTTQPGQREKLIEAFRANVAAVRAEVGCIEYTGVVDHQNTPAAYGEDTFVVVEKWETIENLRAHAVAPHMAAYAAKTKELVKDKAIHVMTAAS